MSLVVVERSFDEPTKFETLQSLEDAVAWCLEQHRVRALGSHLSRDGTRMVCVYEAPDVESVRATQDTGRLAYAGIWAAARIEAPSFEPHEGYSMVIVERDYADPISVDRLRDAGYEKDGCLQDYRTFWSHSYLADHGRRALCLFEAPDAESARIGNRQSGLDYARAWAARNYGW